MRKKLRIRYRKVSIPYITINDAHVRILQIKKIQKEPSLFLKEWQR